MTIQVTDQMVDAFKAAWEAADAAGNEGNRSRAGLEAAVALIPEPSAHEGHSRFGVLAHNQSTRVFLIDYDTREAYEFITLSGAIAGAATIREGGVLDGRSIADFSSLAP